MSGEMAGNTLQMMNVQEITEVLETARGGQVAWRRTPLRERIAIAERYAEELKQQADNFTNWITMETGKLPGDAQGEVQAAIAKVQLSIQALHQRCDDRLISTVTNPVDAGSLKTDRRLWHTPLGTVLVLGPFNFPLHLPGSQIIPALLAGNTVVFKPSELATRVGLEMVKLWRQAGLPQAALQCITGAAATAKAAIDSPLVNGVFFTGSRAAGLSIHHQLAGRPEVLVALEMGGNNPVMIAPSADPQRIAEIVSFSAFASSGQRCTCARRAILIESPRMQHQLDAITQRAKRLRIGRHDKVADAEIGPLVNEDAADRIEQTYRRLIEIGGEPIIPFQRESTDRALVHPTIVDGRPLDQGAIDLVGEMEWFGPLLVLFSAENLDRAIQVANSTPYGLSAALLGGTSEDFQRVGNQVNAGVINYNAPTTGAAGLLPFGGLGHSGNHRAAGFHAVDFCCDPVASIQSEAMPSTSPWKGI